MESTFVWILMFAGAAVALLGVFLVASERELKNKRREIDGLLAKLEGNPQNAPNPATDGSIAEDAAVTELRAQNRELENKLNALSNELAHARNTIEAQAVQRQDSNDQEETRRLTNANDQLARENAELRSRLAASEANFASAQGPESKLEIGRMQAEIDGLRQTLESSQAQVRELESARHNLPDLSAIEAERDMERRKFQEQISTLEQRLAVEQENVAQMQSLRDRLAEAENVHSSLRAEITRHENEIPRWQARITAAEESGQRLAALQTPCKELLARHTELTDHQRRLQEELVAFARQITAPAGDFHAAASESEESEKKATSESAEPVGKSSTSQSFASFDGNAAPSEARPAQEASHGGAAPERTSHRFGILGAFFFILATGAVGLQFMSSDWEQPSAQVMAHAPEQTLPVAHAATTDSKRAVETVSALPAVIPASVKPAPQPSEALEVKPNRAPTQPSLGTYKVTQPSRVYSAPNELSRSLGDIEPGINVNVVDARDGWLEIHSKHGRPPGFIRREVATRITNAH